MTLQEFYQEIGGNYDGILELLGSDAMILTIIKSFPKSGGYDDLLSAVEAKDIASSFKAAHTLKGTAANMRFDRLYEVASVLTEQLRPQTETANPALLQNVTEEYQKLLAAIEKL